MPLHYNIPHNITITIITINVYYLWKSQVFFVYMCISISIIFLERNWCSKQLSESKDV